MSDTPIEDHALLSDCRSAALVDRAGSVVWWCLPRFDSPSVFARLLDEDGGHFAIRPIGAFEASRRYGEASLVLTTTFRTETAVAELTEALAVADGARGHELGVDSPGVLLRRMRCVSGELEVAVEFAPRFEYGLTHPRVHSVDGAVVAIGGPTTVILSTSVPFDRDGSGVSATVRIEAGNDLCFAVQYGSSWEEMPKPIPAERVRSWLTDTTTAWQSWSELHQRYDGPYADMVHHSGRVLQALTHVPTGAIIAAPTTSLPEVPGGSRNWDYRFSWARDASFTLDALWVAACPDESHTFFDFLATAASSLPMRDQLQIVFGVGGERDLTERQLDWLSGWRDSAPVRVGNAAWRQRQNDVYGELLNAAHRLRDQLGDLGDVRRDLLVDLADTAAGVWREPDHGIWEIRDEPKRHLYSTLMCWVALDRAIDLADLLGAEDKVEAWRQERDEIRRVIMDRGWNEERRAFMQTLDGHDLDASSLIVPMVGFLPADDPKVLSTLEAVERDLTDSNGMVYRYRSDDGLPGEEAPFLLCTFWLAEALAGGGRVDEARRVFERAAAAANDVGLLAEEADETGALLGNFPQAFSHVGLINAAWAISRAEKGGRGTDAPEAEMA